jgi:hypothetical protein
MVRSRRGRAELADARIGELTLRPGLDAQARSTSPGTPVAYLLP